MPHIFTKSQHSGNTVHLIPAVRYSNQFSFFYLHPIEVIGVGGSCSGPCSPSQYRSFSNTLLAANVPS